VPDVAGGSRRVKGAGGTCLNLPPPFERFVLVTAADCSGRGCHADGRLDSMVQLGGHPGGIASALPNPARLPAEAEVSVHIYQGYSRVGSGSLTEVLLANAGRRRRT
jgi:hypothetical protein